MSQPNTSLSKRLAVAVQAHEESIINKTPAALFLAKKELQAICDEIDAMFGCSNQCQPPPETK